MWLAEPPPRGAAAAADDDALERLRHFWLAGSRPTRELAAELGVSRSHLIRLLRGDRRPSRRLREHIAQLVGEKQILRFAQDDK